MRLEKGRAHWSLLFFPTLLAFLSLTPGTALALFTNGDFETGDFTAWTKSSFLNTGLILPQPFTGASIVRATGGYDQSVIVTSTPPESGADPFLGATASLKYPKFGLYSARVNGSDPSLVSNSILQQTTVTTADIDPSDGQVHVRFVFAPVLEDPGHPPEDQPYFYFGVRNVTQGNALIYEQFVFSGQIGVPWKTSPINAGVKFTDWQFVDIAPSLPIAVGDVIELEAIGADCAQGAHFGYVYVDSFGSDIPGLSVTKAADVSGVWPGGNLTYTFFYENNAATAANNVVITETIPPCATYVSSTNPSTGGSCSFAAGVVTCNLGTLTPNASGFFTVTVEASSDVEMCQVIHNGDYTIQATDVPPTLGPLVTTLILTGDVDYSLGSVNKAFSNGTNQPANDFEWLLEGTPLVIGHHDGPASGNPSSTFGSFTINQVGGNTLLTWRNPGANIAPGGLAQLGFSVLGPMPKTLKTTWTLDGLVTGCVPQATVSVDDFGSIPPDFTLLFGNTAQDFGQLGPCWGTKFIGGIVVEWLDTEAPLEDLVEGVDRFPVRTDVIPGTYSMPGDTELPLSIPSPPANARFAVVKVSIADNPGMTDPSIDYVQVEFQPAPAVPVASQWGHVTLIALVAWFGTQFSRRSKALPLPWNGLSARTRRHRESSISVDASRCKSSVVD
jgi:uncharacterized repeat protein (TIGR01451 family)